MNILETLWSRLNRFCLQTMFALRYRSEERGLAALEYIAIAVLIVVAIVAAFRALGVEMESQVRELTSNIFG